MKAYKNTKSYALINKLYYPLFESFERSDTIFRNAAYRPPVDDVYKEFILSEAYQIFINATASEQPKIIKSWLLEHVFNETTLATEFQLILENEEIPYDIEYKILNTYEKIMQEGQLSTAIGASLGSAATFLSHHFIFAGLGPFGMALSAAAGILALNLGLSDSDRKMLASIPKNIGQFIGNVIAANPSGNWKKEVLKTLEVEKLADVEKECSVQHGNYRISDSSTLSRFIEDIKGDKRRYEYTRCVGFKMVGFYINSLKVLDKLLRSNDVDDNAIELFEKAVGQRNVTQHVFRNIARISKNKNVFKVTKTLNELSEAIESMIDALINSNDSEYSRIGYELRKKLDEELKSLSYEFKKSKNNRVPMNTRDYDSKDSRSDRYNDTRNDSRDNKNFNSRDTRDTRDNGTRRNPF